MAIFNFLKKSHPQKKAYQGTKSPVEKKPKATFSKTVKTEPIKKNLPKKKDILAEKLLKEPHISEKATNLSAEGKYIFKVYKNANKSEIKKAISNFYGVAVKNVNIINIKSKVKLLRGQKGKKTGYKKALVTLERGHKIEILPH